MFYQVQVSTNPSFTNLVVNKTVEDVTDYALIKDLEPFAVYYWRVKAINPLTGAQSEWSAPCTFRIKAADVTIEHSIDKPSVNNSYIWYGSTSFGLIHKFIRSYDKECIAPDACIGAGMADMGIAQIGAIGQVMDATIGSGLNGIGIAHIGVDYCPGVCVPQFDGFELEIIFTELNEPLYTEDGYMLALEF